MCAKGAQRGQQRKPKWRENLQTRLRIGFYPRSFAKPLKDRKQEREMITVILFSLLFKQRDTGCCVEHTLGGGRRED